MLFHWTVAMAVLAGLTSILTFIIYVRARMHEEEKREKRFMSIHFLSLFLFVFLGVLILIMLSNMNL